MTKIQDLRGDSRILGPTNPNRAVSAITKIARHHSATETGDVWAFQNHWRGTLGWGTGGYHEIILRDGTVQRIYNDVVTTNGVGNHNTNTYHICVVGNGSFTAEQEKAFEERAKDAMKRFGLKYTDVLGHNEFSGHSSNTCPGINMNSVRERLKGNSTTNDSNNGSSNTNSNNNSNTSLPSGVKAASGSYTVQVDTNIRSGASTKSTIVGTYKKGQSFNYDGYIDAEGYRWYTYIAHSGARRYVAAVSAASGGSSSSNTTNNLKGSNLPNKGTYKFTTNTNIRAAASTSSAIVGSYAKGQTVNYDSKVTAGGYVWLSWIGGSGIRRYAAVV